MGFCRSRCRQPAGLLKAQKTVQGALSVIKYRRKGFVFLDAVAAAAILSLTAAAGTGLFLAGARLAERAGYVLEATALAQARLEEIKDALYVEVVNKEKAPCPENPAYSYEVAVSGSPFGYGLKTVTVTVYFLERGEEKSLSFTTEKGER